MMSKLFNIPCPRNRELLIAYAYIKDRDNLKNIVSCLSFSEQCPEAELANKLLKLDRERSSLVALATLSSEICK